MMRALWTAASGMTSEQSNVDTISNNLANINTAGYKTEKAEFKSLLYQNLQSRSTNSDGTAKPISAQVGLGTRMASVTSRFSQGILQETGNFMDWGLEGDGFYKINNGTETLYTRNASFSLSIIDESKVMVTNSNGWPVLDVDNNPIVINTRDDQGNLVYNTANLEVHNDGSLYCRNETTGESEPLNIQVGLVQFANPAGLEKTGSSLFKATENSGEPMEETENEVLKKSTFRQNYLEASNVNAADEMVNLIVAQRAYELNSKAIQAADSMMDQANNLRR
ncbi:MAG: flagellar hook-basal body complex protein [Lachnospiraceae bacterium]|nr:flagellar hook-basal body complex protein [Lachnospiraceae bacterium]